MKEKQSLKSFKLTRTELAAAVSVTICLLLCAAIGKLGYSVQALAACSGAVMCTQDSGKASWKAGLTRILGVVIGGAVGIAVVTVDNAAQSPILFDFLCGLGVLACIVICKIAAFSPIQAKVSSLTLLLVVLALSGNARFSYAIARFVGTFCGALIAMLVSMLFSIRRTASEANKS